MVDVTGGAICISPDGKIGIEWNSYRMAWASTQILKGEIQKPIVVNYGCGRGEKFEHVFNP